MEPRNGYSHCLAVLRLLHKHACSVMDMNNMYIAFYDVHCLL
jgi:hypothetical protein